MDSYLLVSELIAAGARFLGEFHKYFPVRTAFWLNDTEERGWTLYVVSDQITDDNFDVAYGEVGRITAENPDQWFDPFLVKLIGTDDPLAKAVVELRHRYPGRTLARLQGGLFGSGSEGEVYIYPVPAPAPVQ